MTVTTLTFTGAVQDVVIAAGIYSVQIEWWGGEGGQGEHANPGGKGDYTKGVYLCSPGDVLHNYVAGAGVDGSSGGAGGWNGGGQSSFMINPPYANTTGGGGGGASDTRVGGTALTNRIGVAGGGGGSGAGSPVGGSTGGIGGDGGGALGQDGGKYGFSTGGGLGGTQTAGHALGIGGSTYYGSGAGAGGGGWWGGVEGAGGYYGGGGGSGNTGTLSSPVMLPGVQSGDGKIVITAVHQTPLAPTPLTPPTGGYAIASGANVFTWQFNGDVQTRTDFRYKQHSGDAWTTLTSVATTASTYTLAASTWTAGNLVEWQVSNYDSMSLQSPWSASSFVNVITAPPTPTITLPTSGAMVYNTPIDVTWTTGGPTADAYRVQRCDTSAGTGTVYYDSGIVLGTGTEAFVPLDAAAGRTDYLRLTYRFSGIWSSYGTTSILDEFGPPWPPVVTAVADPATASVTVTISNAAAGRGCVDTVANDLYRTGIDGVPVPIARVLAPNAVIVDDLPGAGLITYQAVAFGASGSSASSV